MNNRGVVATGDKSSIPVWCGQTGEILACFQTSSVCALAFSADMKYLAAVRDSHGDTVTV